MPLALEADLKTFRTADGSFTLRSDRWNEQYHSVHGAVQESLHVFLRNGLDQLRNAEGAINILEVGLGTGLNMLLTLIAAERSGRPVIYHALEPHPLSIEILEQLQHWDQVGRPDLREAFLELMSGGRSDHSTTFSFRLDRSEVASIGMENTFDVVYFDAFGPRVQPEMWTVPVFDRIVKAMRAGGILVTYCAKGEVRRNMMAAGLKVERIAGPPGKREMLRATKP